MAWLASDPVVERTELAGGTWVDVVHGLVPDADRVHDELIESVAWQQGRVWRYERWMDEPRLSGWQKEPERHPALAELGRWLVSRYRVRFDGPGLARYRNERDSVAWHRDRELRFLDETVIGIVTLGATRPFMMRPITGRRAEADDMTGVIDFRPSSGDLVVMGGRAQADWLHAVPKLQTRCRSRISAQWRWTSRRGTRDTNPSYYAPRKFSNGNFS